MNKPTRYASVLAATLAMLAGGCAMTSQQSESNAFPTGKFQNGENVVNFNADGTYVGTTTQSEDWVKGTYEIAGNQFTIVDTWESDRLNERMGKSCIGMPGKYRWTLAGDVLTGHVIDDPCEGRKQGTDGVPWTRMK